MIYKKPSGSHAWGLFASYVRYFPKFHSFSLFFYPCGVINGVIDFCIKNLRYTLDHYFRSTSMITPEMIFELLNKKAVLLTPEEVACVCNVDVKTLYNKKSKRNLPFPIFEGLGRWQVRVTDLLTYLNRPNEFNYKPVSKQKLVNTANPSSASTVDNRIARHTRKLVTQTLTF